MTVDTLLSRLEVVKATGPGRWIARCPSYQDRSPSLSIREVDGRILIHDFAGCSAADILAAVGLSLRDLFADRPPCETPSKVVRVRLRDLIPLLRHEAHVIALVGADMLSSRTIEQNSWDRLAEAIRRIEGVSNELFI